MKNLLLTFAIIAVSCSCLAQTIPNAGFESWGPYNATYTTQVPTHWWGIDLFVMAFDPNYTGHSVDKTTQSHSGNFALLCQTVINHGDTVGGLAFSNDSLRISGLPQGFSYNTRSSNLTGYYKFTRVGGDSAGIVIGMTKWNGNHRDTLVNQSFLTLAPAANYTQFNLPLTYLLNQTPDTVIIGLGLQNRSASATHVGTQFFVDDLAFTGTAPPTGLAEITNENESIKIYPNPFSTNALITINASVSLNTAELIIYDVTGKQVKKISNFTSSKTNINCEGLNKGVYFYKLFDNHNLKTTGKFVIE